MFWTHNHSICVFLIALSIVAISHADFAFNFSTPVDLQSNFFFLLSNKTSPPTFSPPFGVVGNYLDLTKDRKQTAHAMWYRHMQFVDDGFNFTFTFRIPDKTKFSGDGIAFVIQPATMGPFDPFLKNPADYCPIGAAPAGCLPNPPPEFARPNNEVIVAVLAHARGVTVFAAACCGRSGTGNWLSGSLRVARR
jgi:hypothetical protein